MPRTDPRACRLPPRRVVTAPVHGVLVVDKPGGMTSHDVVARARRALGTRAIGHAGTLDPMATGVLVLAVGEGTKLVQHLTGQDKEYEATVRLGVETDSLDADGTVTGTREVPPDLGLEQVRQAARGFIGEQDQQAPAVSAIKVGGKALHRRVRAGERVEAPVRRVVVRELEVLQVQGPDLRLRVACAKGFYVRALARDLAGALGTVGHLTRLRRTRSGTSRIEDAAAWEVMERAAAGDDEAKDALRGAVVGLREAWGQAPAAELTEEGARDVRHGRPVIAERIRGGLPELDEQTPVALLHDGRVVALGRRDGDRLRVTRGIREQP